MGTSILTSYMETIDKLKDTCVTFFIVTLNYVPYTVPQF